MRAWPSIDSSRSKFELELQVLCRPSSPAVISERPSALRLCQLAVPAGSLGDQGGPLDVSHAACLHYKTAGGAPAQKTLRGPSPLLRQFSLSAGISSCLRRWRLETGDWRLGGRWGFFGGACVEKFSRRPRAVSIFEHLTSSHPAGLDQVEYCLDIAYFSYASCTGP